MHKQVPVHHEKNLKSGTAARFGLRCLFICFPKILIDTESLLNPVIVLSATAVLIKTHGIIPVNKRTSTTQKSGARKLHMNCVF